MSWGLVLVRFLACWALIHMAFEAYGFVGIGVAIVCVVVTITTLNVERMLEL